MSDALPLAHVLLRVRRTLALNFPAPLWITAELSSVSERRGHRYLELVEKGEAGELEARVQAVVWSRNYAAVLRKRGVGAAAVLSAGQAVCLRVEVDYHEVYGLKLAVQDWDPAFTTGQLELRRRAIVERLEAGGLLGRNARIALPPVVQRVAILTSSRAAGYADFAAQLRENAYGYAFAETLVDVSVQGPQVAVDVPAALDRLADTPHLYDAAVIIRGGGSPVDLASFDDEAVGTAIARCSVPVLVGIGHEIDETVPDLVAHTSLKTPTAVADFVVDHNARYESAILETSRRIGHWATRGLHDASSDLTSVRERASAATARRLSAAAFTLDTARADLGRCVRQRLLAASATLDARATRLLDLEPARVLERGYSLTTARGAVVRAPGDAPAGTTLTTHLARGTLESITT